MKRTIPDTYGQVKVNAREAEKQMRNWKFF